MSDIVQKLWGFCHTLRHDGVDYGDYIEQLTYLLFLKMADERGASVPAGCDWASLKDLSGTALTDHYADILRKLREAGGLLADIFAQATPRFNNPVNLKRIIAMIDEEDWSAMDVDVKGAAFEGLLEKAASEGKKGADAHRDGLAAPNVGELHGQRWRQICFAHGGGDFVGDRAFEDATPAACARGRS